MNMASIKTAAVMASLLASAGAMAQNYVVAGIGPSHANVDCAGTISCSNSGTGGKLVGGYGFGNGWSAEFGYLNFGSIKATQGNVSVKAKADGFGIGAAYQLPLNMDWGLSFGLGVARIKMHVDGALAGVGSASLSESSTSAYGVIGLNYALSKQGKLELALNSGEAKFEGEKAGIRTVTIGYRHEF